MPIDNPPTAFTKQDPWRIFRIMAEFVDSFENLFQGRTGRDRFRLGPQRGPATTTTRRPWPWPAVWPKNNLPVITGGGPGIMEAANRGAAEAGGQIGRPEHRAALRAKGQPLTPMCRSISIISSRARSASSNIALALFSCRAASARLTNFLKSSPSCKRSAFPRFPLILFGRRLLDRPAALDEGHAGEKTNSSARAIWILFTITDDPKVAVNAILDYMRQVGPPDVTPRTLG